MNNPGMSEYDVFEKLYHMNWQAIYMQPHVKTTRAALEAIGVRFD